MKGGEVRGEVMQVTKWDKQLICSFVVCEKYRSLGRQIDVLTSGMAWRGVAWRGVAWRGVQRVV